jgi:hypothetical protein
VIARRAAMLAVLGVLGASSGAGAQIVFRAATQIGRAEHRILDADALVAASGTVFGAALTLAVRDQYEVRAEVWGGRLHTSGSPTLDDHDVADVQLIGAYKALPWLLVQAGADVRSYTNVLARQRWTALRVGAEAHVPLATESIRGVLRGYWLPVVSVKDFTRPKIALAASVGLEWQGSRISVGTTYTLERYDFASSAGARRLEQLSSLQLRAGLRWPH